MLIKRILLVTAALMTATAAHSETAVKIGVLTDMSGTYSDLAGPGSVWAANKAVKDFGAGAKGMKVEVISADHQNKGDIASGIARRWYDTENVNVVVDLVTSSTALAVNEVAKEKNKVALVSGAGSSEITGGKCNANTLHWAYDTYSLANGTGNAIVKTGGLTWYFVTADYAFGQALERDATAVITANGGKVLGSVKHPFPAQDFSSYLLQAQGSGAKIIGLANAGADTTNAIKQASEFGVVQAGQNLAGLLVFITDVHALGLKTAQGLIFTEAWYWDMNDANRAFAKEYAAANNGKYPTMVHAGVYSSVIHYLKAVEAMKSAGDGGAIVAKMKEMPTEDALFGKGSVREDGRKIHDMYLFEVKKPDESKAPWDYYKLRATIPAAEAWRPLAQSTCSLVKK